MQKKLSIKFGFFLFLLSVLSISLDVKSAFAVSPEWRKELGPGIECMFLYPTSHATDGDYVYTVGGCDTTFGFQSTWKIEKRDSDDGSVEWSKKFFYSGKAYAVTLSDSLIYVLGVSGDNLKLLKLRKSDGSKVWDEDISAGGGAMSFLTSLFGEDANFNIQKHGDYLYLTYSKNDGSDYDLILEKRRTSDGSPVGEPTKIKSYSATSKIESLHVDDSGIYLTRSTCLLNLGSALCSDNKVEKRTLDGDLVWERFFPSIIGAFNSVYSDGTYVYAGGIFEGDGKFFQFSAFNGVLLNSVVLGSDPVRIVKAANGKVFVLSGNSLFTKLHEFSQADFSSELSTESLSSAIDDSFYWSNGMHKAIAGDSLYLFGGALVSWTVEKYGITDVDAGAPLIDQASITYSGLPSGPFNPGESFNGIINVQNAGDYTWTAGQYKLVDIVAPVGSWGVSEFNLASNVGPGEMISFDGIFTAPAATGFYDFQWQMKRIDNLSLILNPGSNLNFEVAGAAVPPASPPPPIMSGTCGSALGETFCVKPEEPGDGLCGFSNTIPEAVAVGNKWEWKCTGTDGGEIECSAFKCGNRDYNMIEVAP